MGAARRTGWLTAERLLRPAPAPLVGFLPAEGLLEPDDTAADRVATAAARRTQALVAGSGLDRSLIRLDPRPADHTELARVHDVGYINAVQSVARAGGGWVGDHTWVGPDGDELAALAAGACIAAAQAVVQGRVDNAYALVWPPGHHARADTGAGFCVFANAALAAHAALAAGLERIAIIDWDAHRGDGTHAAFAHSQDVLTVSLHQEKPNEPASDADCAVDIPLPYGSGPAAYDLAFAEVVAPAVARHRPELVIVSCGYDASTLDPMARLVLHSEGFRALTRATLTLARESGGGGAVFCHEGGYSPAYVPICALAVLEELSGVRTGFEDPFLRRWHPFAGDELTPEQAAAVTRAAGRLGD